MEKNIYQFYDTIEGIKQCDIEYDKFRSRVREFICRKSMTKTQFALDCHISRYTLDWFLDKGYRRLSARMISKMYNYMEDHK
jgi:hypothetical protein